MSQLDLIFGKDKTQKIVNITVNENLAYIYSLDKNSKAQLEITEHTPYALTYKEYNLSHELKGNQYYKYITPILSTKYQDVFGEGIYKPRSKEEGFMLLNGATYYKSLKVKDVSLLSFDIEDQSTDPIEPENKVVIISNTFRDRNGIITKKLFTIDEYNTCEEMILDWCKWVRTIDPDIMTGHNIFAYDFEKLRLCSNLPLGRDGSNLEFDEKPSKFRKDAQQQYQYFNIHCHGREIIDNMFLCIKYDIGRQFPSYGLKRIEEHLGIAPKDRIDWNFKKNPVSKIMKERGQLWEDFKKYAQDDSDSPVYMFDLMIPAFFYLAQSVPKSLQQIINEASGSQLDSIMIRSYLQNGYSQPKSTYKRDFEGAISMGIPGIYEHVRKVDVAALYPSIMLEYKIYDSKKDPSNHMLQILDYFRTERLKNKKLAKDTNDSYYEDLQGAQKIMINSMYGFMGANYLLYNFPLGAEKVTFRGREILLKGVEWATGCDLSKVVKKIVNEGDDDQETKYEWILGDKISEGLGYQLVNVDTDSFSYTNGTKPTKEDFKKEIEQLNKLYPETIKWEDDGVYDKLVVIKAKNYVLEKDGKIKYKGSSILDQKKEPALREFMDAIIGSLLKKDLYGIQDIYNKYCKEVLDITNINRWCVKKTVTKSILKPKRLNEQKPNDALKEALTRQVINSIQEGDKIWLYQALDGSIQKTSKGKPEFFKKDGKPKMIDNKVLRFPELWNKDHDKWHYIARLFDTLTIFENILDIKQYKNYSLAKNRKLIENNEVMLYTNMNEEGTTTQSVRLSTSQKNNSGHTQDIRRFN